MTNIEKYNKLFVDTFSVDERVLGDGFCKCSVDGWDSVRQLSLVSSCEDEFSIMMEPEDILGFVSYSAGKMILKKYGIEL